MPERTESDTSQSTAMFIASPDRLREAASDKTVGTIAGSVSDLHSTYCQYAKHAGDTVLSINDSWNRFRSRFPGTYWSWHDEQHDPDNEVITRHTFVVLGAEDERFARRLNKYGEVNDRGVAAILMAFIQRQDDLVAQPHPEDEVEKLLPFDYRGPFIILRGST